MIDIQFVNHKEREARVLEEVVKADERRWLLIRYITHTSSPGHWVPKDECYPVAPW